MKITLKNTQIAQMNNTSVYSFPKYTTQIINLANGNAGATRPKRVGQMSELFVQYQNEVEEITPDTWEAWYTEHYPEAIGHAAANIWEQIKNLYEAIGKITEKMTHEWVEDLVFSKTFNGMYFQQVVIAAVAEAEGKKYRLSTPKEEAKGIDGFIGGEAVSVKPDTYETMGRLPEDIDVRMLIYTKKKDGIVIIG